MKYLLQGDYNLTFKNFHFVVRIAANAFHTLWITFQHVHVVTVTFSGIAFLKNGSSNNLSLWEQVNQCA